MRKWLAVFVALAACVYVCAVNRAGIWHLESQKGVHVMRGMELFLKLQWIGFVVPALGVLIALGRVHLGTSTSAAAQQAAYKGREAAESDRGNGCRCIMNTAPNTCDNEPSPVT
jgi:hypothetical protein